VNVIGYFALLSVQMESTYIGMLQLIILLHKCVSTYSEQYIVQYGKTGPPTPRDKKSAILSSSCCGVIKRTLKNSAHCDRSYGKRDTGRHLAEILVIAGPQLAVGPACLVHYNALIMARSFAS
jgi:hypothetical protein